MIIFKAQCIYSAYQQRGIRYDPMSVTRRYCIKRLNLYRHRTDSGLWTVVTYDAKDLNEIPIIGKSETDVAYNFNCRVEAEGRLKVTGSRVHCKLQYFGNTAR